jgi:hypothetical protein
MERAREALKKLNVFQRMPDSSESPRVTHGDLSSDAAAAERKAWGLQGSGARQ